MTEKTWDEEMEAIESERDLELAPAASTNPNGPEDMPEDQPEEPEQEDDEDAGAEA